MTTPTIIATSDTLTGEHDLPLEIDAEGNLLINEWDFRTLVIDARALRDWLNEVLPNEQGTEWQPIETAPKDRTAVLIFVPTCFWELADKVEAQTYIAFYHNGRWRDDDGEIIDDPPTVAPTHWIPLPDPPAKMPEVLTDAD